MTETRYLPTVSTDSWDWQLHAACRTLPESVFFHPEGERGWPRTHREQRAKAVCASCPVSTECLEHALAAREPYGIWGGMSETERHQLLARTRRGASGVQDFPVPRRGNVDRNATCE